MKKYLSLVLSLLILLSLLPQCVSAEVKSICIENVVANYREGTVSVSGTLQGYKPSPWRKSLTVGITVLDSASTAESAENDNSEIFHVDEIPIEDATGKFTYVFTHSEKEPNDNCTVVLSCDGYTSAQADYSFFSSDVQNNLLESRNIACVDSPIYYIKSVLKEEEQHIYRENGEVYIPSRIAAAIAEKEFDEFDFSFTVGNTTFTSEYITATELSEVIDLNVSADGVIYSGAELTAAEEKSLIPMFGIHVSPKGSDSASGNASAPVKTISRALELYPTAMANGYIFVHAGAYEDEVVIDDKYKDLKIRALGDAVLTPSTIRLNKESFSRVTDADVLGMLPDIARGEVLTAKVPGCNDDSILYKVFASGLEQSLARFPNGEGFAIASGAIEAASGATFESLYYSDKQKLEAWGKDPKARVLLFRNSGYLITKARLISTQVQSGTMQLAWTGSKPYQPAGKRFFVYDTLTELDVPGEWYIDRENERIYYYPSEDFDGLNIVTGSETPLTLKNTKNITIEGLTIQCALKNGVILDKSDNVKLKDCTVRNIGTHGINGTLLTNSTIESCHVHDTGESGIRVNYKDYTNGVNPDLTDENNLVTNCTVHHIGLLNPISGAVYFGGTGNTFSHNTVHDCPHMAIWFMGNDHTIEYSDFYNALKYCDDAGVIYGNPGMTGFGTVIQYNRVHRFESLNPYNGEIYMIYLDANTSGITMKENIIDLSNYTGYANAAMIGGGRNNAAIGNILIGGSANGEMRFWMSNRYNKKVANLHKGLISDMAFYKFINKLTNEQKEKWFTKYSALIDEYNRYAEYAKGSAGTDPTGAEVGVARDCYVKDNIIVNEREYEKFKVNTYEANTNLIFGPHDTTNSDKGTRFDINLSTGNQFLSEYDYSDAPAMTAGSDITTGKEVYLTASYPLDGAVIKSGPVRFAWKSDGSQASYFVCVTDEEGKEVYSTTTVEKFAEAVLPSGKYKVEVATEHIDGMHSDSYEVSFECTGTELDLIATIDLSSNTMYHKKGEKGQLNVMAYDFGGAYSDVTGMSGLTYKSSDPTVVEVSAKGEYTVVGNGSAVITVTAGKAEKSMVIYSSETVYNSLTLDNYKTYKFKSLVELVDDPTGNGNALVESKQPSLFAREYKSYAMGLWVYDNLSHLIRFGVNSSVDNHAGITPQVFFGLREEVRNQYHLRHHHTEPGTASPTFLKNLTVERSEGWHQIFMTVEYDSENDISYVDFYFDGQHVVSMLSNSVIDTNTLEQNTKAPIKERFIVENTPAKFAYVSSSVDNGEEVLASGQVTLSFNKSLDSEATAVNEAYYTASDGTRIEASVSVKDNYAMITPMKKLASGESYTLTLDADFVNVPTAFVSAMTIEKQLELPFKVREAVRTMEVTEHYETTNGKAMLEVSVESLLKEGKQSVHLIFALKDEDEKLIAVSSRPLTLEPLEKITESITCDEGNIVEAYIWDTTNLLFPLKDKFTNKEKE